MTDHLAHSFPLIPRPSPEQVAHLLHEEPSFIWLDGGSTRHLIFRNPVTLISCDGSSNSLAELQSGVDSCPPHYLLAGYVGYEVAHELEEIAAGPVTSPLPRMFFGVYDSALVMDEAGRWFASGGAEYASRENKFLSHAAATCLPPPPGAGAAYPTSDDESFVRGVREIIGRIYQGDLFQTNLCRRLETSLPPESAWALYRRMRRVNPAAYGAFLRVGADKAVLSGSPELFLKVTQGTIESRPIKGTRPRGTSDSRDTEFRADLLRNPKDKGELAMVVDVTRNDLSRVCKPGSVSVVSHGELMTLRTLHHTLSRVKGSLREVTASEILGATFPPASITGAPKISAMQAAHAQEREARGPCMGAIGWISPAGEMELSVAIRTAWTNAGKLTYLAGCGITANSTPELELAESRDKAVSFLTALGFLK